MRHKHLSGYDIHGDVNSHCNNASHAYMCILDM